MPNLFYYLFYFIDILYFIYFIDSICFTKLEYNFVEICSIFEGINFIIPFVFSNYKLLGFALLEIVNNIEKVADAEVEAEGKIVTDEEYSNL